MVIVNNVDLEPCPHCGSKANIVDTSGGFAIHCENRNCLGQMRLNYGTCDDKEIFLKKLISDWNKRSPEVMAVNAAVECLTKYRNSIYDQMQEPYDEHGICCIDVLDEAINRLKCFTSIDAVRHWVCSPVRYVSTKED